MRLAAPNGVARPSTPRFAAGLLSLVLAAGAAALPPHCPAPATVDIYLDGPSDGGAVDVALDGTLADPDATCEGAGDAAYGTGFRCAPGPQLCGRITGLRPGAWINRLRVQVPFSDPQVQASHAVFIAGGAGVVNTLRWTIYPRTLVVTQPSAAELRLRLATAATGPHPTLVTFAPDAFPPGQGDAHPIMLAADHCTPTDVAALCVTTSDVVVDALDANAAPGAVTLATNDRARLVRVYGDDVVLRGLVLRGSRTTPATSQADTLVLESGAHRARVEQCVIHGPASGDAVEIGGLNGAADGTVADCEMLDAEDRGVKVSYGAHAVVRRSCVHDNHNGGIQSTLGGHVTTEENLVQHNVPNASQNGLTVTGNGTARTTLDARGDVVRFAGGRGVSVVDDASATLTDAYVADNAVAGIKVETVTAGRAPTATVRGTAFVCNKTKGVSGVCPADDTGARAPCVTDADCCAGDPLCQLHCAFRTPEGFGVAVAACTDAGCRPPDVDLGTPRAPGADALTQNRNTSDGANLNDQLGGRVVPAVGNQWEHCGTGTTCDSSAIHQFDVRGADGAVVDASGGMVARDGVPLPLRISPARPRKGDLVRIYGQQFNAIDGAACAGISAPRTPCGGENPAVTLQNRLAPNGNTVTLILPGALPFAADIVAVTPTMLAFTMPVDCYAGGTLRVAKRTLAGTREGQELPLCDIQGCQGQPDGTPCDDGDACTDDDRCDAGECHGGPPVSCGGACLGCDRARGCIPLPAAATCDDGDACTIGDHCRGDADVCVAGPGGGCAGQCLTGACGPGGACVPSLPGAPCSDGDACTTDACDGAGTCVSEPATGFPSVTCVFEGDGVRTPDCAHDGVPLEVTRRYARARHLVDRAEAVPAHAKPRLQRAASVLAAADRIVTGAATRGRLSSSCATAIVSLLVDTRQRITALATTL